MRPDLQGLEITQGELRKLTGIGAGQVLRRSLLRDRDKRSRFLLRQIPEILCLTLVGLLGFGAGYQGLVHLSWIGPSLLVWGSAALAILLLATMTQTIRVYKTSTPALVRLMEDVDRYNAVIRAIDINDQIEAAGNPNVALRDRNHVIATLWTTRNDLTRALKTERILRENHRFIARNTDFFTHDLTSLSVLQVRDQVDEQGRFLNEALEIAFNVQQEMRALQSREEGH